VKVLSGKDSPARLLFGVHAEMSLPTFFSVMVTVAASAAFTVVGRLVGGIERTAFYVAAALLLAMAADDFMAVHERLGVFTTAIFGSDVPGYLWVIPGALIGIVVLALFARLMLRLSGPARTNIVLGIAIFFFAAVGLEFVGGIIDTELHNRPLLQVEIHVEEFLEMLGMILVLRGGLLLLEISRRGPMFSMRAVEAGLRRSGPAAA
jgi:hypothetical protein